MEKNDKILLYHRLEDVPLPVLSGEPLDQGIISLVRALRALRLATKESCEGHETTGKKTYPWVELMPYEQLGNLDRSLEGYNQRSDIAWIRERRVLHPGEAAILYKDRRILQDSAACLAQYLFEHRPELYL